MIITPRDNYRSLDSWFSGKIRVMVVCDESIHYMKALYDMLLKYKDRVIFFSDFHPNPDYMSVVKGVTAFREGGCDAVMAVGGGSAIDVAKCIKLFETLPGTGEDGSWLNASYEVNNIDLLAMPTTAGTGSEATRYAVIYHNGVKQNITHQSIIPRTVLMDPSVLKTLPLYQKKATMCDALCHAIESFWSINSTEQSKLYSRAAIKGVLGSMDGYLSNTDKGNEGMLMAAYKAGQAINITQTTAGHAMSYKITSLFGCAHGHAVMLCDRILFDWMVRNTSKCCDPRGREYLEDTLDAIGAAMGCEDAAAGAAMLAGLFDKLELPVPLATPEQFAELCSGVNKARLKNNPVELDNNAVKDLYHMILR